MSTGTRSFLVGAIAGAALTAILTDAVPKMFAGMMQKMMIRMGAEGGPAEM